MNGFLVDLKNEPGALASVAEAIAEKGIDITAFSGATCGDSGSIALITNDEAGTKRVLADRKFTYQSVEWVTTSIENKPGSLAMVARRLADAGVNIAAAMPTGMSGGNVTIAFATDNPVKAREALGTSTMAGASSR
jgi:hypothetical protein